MKSVLASWLYTLVGEPFSMIRLILMMTLSFTLFANQNPLTKKIWFLSNPGKGAEAVCPESLYWKSYISYQKSTKNPTLQNLVTFFSENPTFWDKSKFLATLMLVVVVCYAEQLCLSTADSQSYYIKQFFQKILTTFGFFWQNLSKKWILPHRKFADGDGV